MSTTVAPGIANKSRSSLQVKQKLWILSAFIVALLVGIEGLTRILHDHRKITLQTERGVRSALSIRRSPGHIQVLFAGNSLISEGTNLPALQQAMGSSFTVCTAGLPGSTYYDWLYGLRSLFQSGSQPEVVVFGISPSQFLRAPAVTALPVSQLWRVQEIFAYYREQRPGMTALSDLVLQHYSTFFYMRDTIRIYVRKAIPGYKTMVDEWTRVSPPTTLMSADKANTVRQFGERLLALHRSMNSQAQLILILVPTNQREDAELSIALRQAATEAGIAVVEPIQEQQWPLYHFQTDGYHLTPAAAIEFSQLAGAELSNILETTPAPQNNR